MREWFYQIQHLFFPRDTLSLFPDSEWKAAGGGGCGGNVEWGRMWWTHLTRANRGAIKESAQPERQGLTFIEVDVYCSSCCTCQEGIKDLFVVWGKLEKSKMLKYQSKTQTNLDTTQCYICNSNLKYFLWHACIFQSWHISPNYGPKSSNLLIMWLQTVNRLPDSNSMFSSLWLTDDTGMRFLCRHLPLPWGRSLFLPPPTSFLSIIVSLDRMKSCFASGYCATGIWELFFLVWIAQSRCQRSAAERPPYNSLEINSSRDFRGTRKARYEEEMVFMVWHVE